MKRFFYSTVAAFFSFCLFTGTASADAPPVYVVDVTGLDAARLREGIGRELHGQAVAPDDPRAATAAGRVTVDSRDGAITVTYRKLGAPLTRTVPLPADAARAESATVLLAGNLARDEAEDVLSALKKPAQSAPRAPAPAKVETDERSALTRADDADRAVLHAYFRENEAQQRTGQKVFGWASMAGGAAVLAPSIYLLAAPHPSGAAENAGLGGIVTGGTFLTLGALTVTDVLGIPAEDLAQRMDRDGLSTDEVVAAWRDRVTRERAMRRTFGAIGMVLGGAAMAAGGTVIAAVGPHADRSAYDIGGLIVLSGLVVTILGGASFAIESPDESNLRIWDSLHAQRTAGVSAPRVGLAPLPGGGMASLGFSF